MIFIASHYTENAGTTDYFLHYLEERGIPFVYLRHPFHESSLQYSELLIFNGKRTACINRQKKAKSPIIDLIRNNLATTWCAVKYGPRATHAYGFGSFNALGLLPLKLLFWGRPQILFWGTDYSEQRFSSPVLNRIYTVVESIVCRVADYVIAPSKKQLKVRIEKHGLSEDRAKYVPNGVSSVGRLGDDQSAYVASFVYIGSITEAHGITEFVKRMYVKQKTPLPLHIFGSGTNQAELEILIQEKKLSKWVYFHGSMKVGEIIEVLKGQDGRLIGVAPYDTERDNLADFRDSLKIKEYISLGMTYLASTAVTIPTDIRAFGVVYGDAEELEEKRLIKSLSRVDMSRASRVIEKYVWANIFDANEYLIKTPSEMEGATKINELVLSGELSNALLIGFYGGTNFGDELLLEVLQRLLKKGNATNTQIFYLQPGRFNTYHANYGSKIINGRSPISVLGALFRQKNIVIGGGGLWGVDFSTNTFVLTVLLYLSKVFLRKQVYLLGIGYYSTTTKLGRLSAKLAGKSAKLIIVRDQESFLAFKYLGGKVRLDRDIAFHIDEVAPLPKPPFSWQGFSVEKNKKTIFISFRHFQGKIASQYVEAIRQLLPLIKEHRIIIAMLESKDTNPELFEQLRMVAADVGSAVDFTSNPIDLYNFFKLSRDSLVVISPQFHAQLCAYLAGAAFVPLVYDNKNAELLKSLNIPKTYKIGTVTGHQLHDFVADVFLHKKEHDS